MQVKMVAENVMGAVLISGKMYFHSISQGVEQARLWAKMAMSLWNLVGDSATMLPKR